MDFNLVSKNNLGVVTALLLVIILSQGRFFNFLLDTALGRAILILFILFISYTNKILGVVTVLFIIIMFNNSNIGYMEGATTMNDSSMGDSSMDDSTKKDDKKPATPAATPAATSAPAPPATPIATTLASATAPATKKTVEGYEGYNLHEIEREGFRKNSGTMAAAKTTNTNGYEAFSGSYNQQYSSF